MKTSIRTCVSCRQKFNKENLYRIINKDNNLFLDIKGNSQGRGSYICSNECFDKLNAKTLSRALRCTINNNQVNKFKEILRNDDMDF